MRSEAEIEALVRAFEACTLPRHEWTHREHLTVALWYLRRLDHSDATALIRQGIKRFNASHGNLAGYHETITLAWIALIARFLSEREPGQPLAVLAADLLLECGDKDYLLQHYSRERLLSDQARHAWLPPDLAGTEDSNPPRPT
jgi:hypothetical protein